MKNLGLKLALLLGIAAINIYPMGCRWGNRITSAPQPVIESYSVIKKDSYIKPLEYNKNIAKTITKKGML